MRKRAFLGLAALAACTSAWLAAAETLSEQFFVASFHWIDADPAFGGMSAIEVDPDGIGFTALSDHSLLYRGRLDRDADGHILRIAGLTSRPLLGVDGQPLDTAHDDSEGLAIAPHGATYVSQEGPARVLRFDGSETTVLPTIAAFAAMGNNSALEALAIDQDGALYTIPERSGATDRPFPVYRYAQGQWTQPFDIPRDGAYLVTAADFGPDGRLYILERDFQGLRGFQSRVRRFDLARNTTAVGETILETGFGQHGNLEGISVWQDATGALRLTMVSDDNFNLLLSTNLVEYRFAD